MSHRVGVLVATVGLLAALALPAVAAPPNGATHLEFTGFVTARNPCNGELVSGPVNTKITYHEVVNANGTHVMVRVNMHGGDLVGEYGNAYRVSLAANAQFDAVQGTYVFDHDSLEWIGHGSTPDFNVDHSVQRIFVVAGQPTGHNFTFASAALCKHPT